MNQPSPTKPINNLGSVNVSKKSLTHWVRILNQNFIFKFLSSIKLAIPLMILLLLVLAVGTFIEAQFSAEISQLIVYKSTWFGVLIFLLWLNILCSTISRIPFKKHHTGFVITHVGLLILLMGSFMTHLWGIEGQILISENETNNRVILPQLMLGFQMEGAQQIQKMFIPKVLSPQNETQLSAINKKSEGLFKIKELIPFSKTIEGYTSHSKESQDLSLSFILQNKTQKVAETLHTQKRAQILLGPTSILLTKVNDFSPQKIKSPLNREAEKIAIYSSDQSQWVGEILIKDLTQKDVSFNNLVFHLVKKATDTKNTQDSLNPSLEIQISKKDQTIKEILYSKFPSFTLNSEGVFGYRFNYLKPLDNLFNESLSRGIEFQVSNQIPHQAQVILYQEGKEILRKILKEGEKLTTPWMGFDLYMGTITPFAIKTLEVRPLKPEKNKDLPPSALYIETADQKRFWILEGEQKALTILNKNIILYFGKELLTLPFELELKKFNKTEYPGTTQALSYESQVVINEQSDWQNISMNQPLKLEGFRIYQASFIQNLNEAPISVFRVNKDPGRALKYLGSLILSLGIFVFIFKRSRALPNKSKLN